MATLIREGSRFAVTASSPCPDGALKMLFAGICGTDVQILRGERTDQAEILGHEGVAWDPVSGHHVTFNPVSCVDQDVVLGHTVPGILRTHVPVDRSCLKPWPQLVKLNHRLATPEGVLVEPLGACLYSWQLIERIIGVPRRVAIWGGGVMGLLNAREGCRRGLEIVLVHPKPERLEWARQWLSTNDAAFLTTFAENSSVDVALLAVPRVAMNDVIEQAILGLRDGGLLVLIGSAGPAHPALPDIDLRAVRRASANGLFGVPVKVRSRTGRAAFVCGHRGTSCAQLMQAQEMLLADLDAYRGLVTHVVQPDELNSLIARRIYRQGSDEFGRQIVKIVADFR